MKMYKRAPGRVSCTLEEPRVRKLLERLHDEAGRQRMAFIPVYLGLAWDAVRGHRATSREEATRLRRLFLPLSAESGRFVYQVALTRGARRVVEYGTSFGISTIYLAAAVRDNGGGTVIGSELEPGKVRRARAYVEEAGLSDLVEIREGDALETLRDVGGKVDLLFLDGWKEQYIDILRLLQPSLGCGSVILADDVYRFPRHIAPYVEYVRDPAHGYSSVPLRIGEGIEYTVRLS